MKEETGEINFGCHGAVICPSCGTGRITKGTTSIDAFATVNHLEASIYMTCPYCGDDLLVNGDGKTIAYEFKEHACKITKIQIVEF